MLDVRYLGPPIGAVDPEQAFDLGFKLPETRRLRREVVASVSRVMGVLDTPAIKIPPILWEYKN